MLDVSVPKAEQTHEINKSNLIFVLPCIIN